MWSMQWNVEFGYQLRILCRTEENHGKLDRIDRSQDLPDTKWLLASSPALNTETLKLVPIWLLLYLKKKGYIFIFAGISFYVHNLYEYQTVAYTTCNIFGENTCPYAHTRIHTYTYLYLWLFKKWWIWTYIVEGEGPCLVINIWELSSYLKGNTLRLRKKAQPVNAVQENSRCLLWEPHGTHRYALWAERRVLVLSRAWV
jgi:hypothetical protein